MKKNKVSFAKKGKKLKLGDIKELKKGGFKKYEKVFVLKSSGKTYHRNKWVKYLLSPK